ncbi:MAG: tRNA (adenosine(37)-N6)-threonylcarbamoyltransferase complex dimerization subunit type 1 TsaB [Anaerolineae bacterium]
MILAIDTATRTASIALYNSTGVLAEESWRSKNNHSVEVMPAIARLVERQGCSMRDLSGIAVSLGPGSFTGLRIGMSVAKGLCLGLEIPIVGVPSLQVAAYAAGDPGCPILAVDEAGRGRICVGRYSYENGLPALQGSIQLQQAEEWTPDLSEMVLVTGEVDAALADHLLSLPGAENLSIVSLAGSLRRAGFLGELAWERLERGDTDDLDTLEPVYVQQPLSGQGA